MHTLTYEVSKGYGATIYMLQSLLSISIDFRVYLSHLTY